jgi:hypothetical protein
MIIPQATLDQLTDRSLAAVQYLVVHHTADNDQAQDAADIAREEIASMGFATIGYHAVIWKDGKVQFGRPIGKVPAANLGLNTVSYAISLEGNFHPPDAGYRGEVPSDEQIDSLLSLIELVKTKLPNLQFLIGHRDVAKIVDDPNDATACPGDLLYAKLHDLRVSTGLHSPPQLL